MDLKIIPNAVNQFPKGSNIFIEGEPVFGVAMIIKGRVLIQNDGARIIMSPGSFLGINDIYIGRFLSTYTAYDDVLVYVYPIKRIEELDIVLSANKDYHGFMVASFYKIIYELDQIYQSLSKHGSELHQFLRDTYQLYQQISLKKGIQKNNMERITSLAAPDSDLDLLRDRINYYLECRNLPIDVVKQFFSYGNAITLYEVEDQVNIVNQQMDALKEMAGSFVKMAECLVDETNSCLFHLIAELSTTSSGDSSDLIDIMDSIIEEINKAEDFTEQMLGTKMKVNRKQMEEVYHHLLTGDNRKNTKPADEAKISNEDMQRAFSELKDSFTKILDYSGIQGDKAETIKAVMLEFVGLKDRFSTEDNARIIRRKLTDNYYEIYKAVFLRAYNEKNNSRLMDLFLKYGYADERLLRDERLLSLYFLPEEEQTQGLCKVYNIKEWLTLIYEGKKEPSKNEFDLEYPEMLLELKKQAKLTEKDVKLWLVDPEKKLEYEIQNMFRYNNRTTNGQIMSFVPFMHEDQLSRSIDHLHVTLDRINEAVTDILKVDYSVFDREVLYVNKEKNITKEYIIKRVYPDIILMPNAGVNGIMWQEITGKRRDSSGRILLPIFTEMDLNILLIRAFGRFRWELCRTIEGIAWNDIAQKSLTSEYADYLQFYRKNKDLSEEKKERIKQQIQKGRNSSREIFVIDYEHWINYEAIGAAKLNKPVREIMATYCPFAKELRERLRLQPQFEEAMARYYRNKLKKVREIESRYRSLQKDSIEITQELIDTLNYHRDL